MGLGLGSYPKPKQVFFGSNVWSTLTINTLLNIILGNHDLELFIGQAQLSERINAIEHKPKNPTVMVQVNVRQEEQLDFSQLPIGSTHTEQLEELSGRPFATVQHHVGALIQLEHYGRHVSVAGRVRRGRAQEHCLWIGHVRQEFVLRFALNLVVDGRDLPFQ